MGGAVDEPPMRGEGCPKLAHSPSARTKACNSPLSAAYAYVEAADFVRHKAAARFDAGLPCCPEANMVKLRASWEAANVRIDTHGGYGFLDKYDVVREFREARLYIVAPISNNHVLAYLGQRVLGLPR